MSLTPVANRKNLQSENFTNFVWTPLGSKVNIVTNFCLQVHLKVSAACYCSHYLPPVSTTPVANLPPVSSTPEVHLDLQISMRIFVKFEMTMMLFSGAWGKVIHEKKLEAKNLMTLSL